MKKLPSLWLSVFTMKHIDDEDTEIFQILISHLPAK